MAAGRVPREAHMGERAGRSADGRLHCRTVALFASRALNKNTSMCTHRAMPRSRAMRTC